MEIALTPFLKWAGGKRWLATDYPRLLRVKYDRYIEPFLGGGAVFFSLAPKAAILTDINADLIDCYRAIRDVPNDVERILRRHQKHHSPTYYYEERDRVRRSLAERAAQFLYLNRTCWNGLYRVNLRGEFNVPIGTKSSVLLPADDFRSASLLLQSAELLQSDFECVIDRAGEGDFVFADPPYTVKHNLNGFLKYNESIFSWMDQRRLQAALVRARKRGASVLVTNANHKSVRELYRDFGEMKTLSRNSVLSAQASSRGRATELSIFSGEMIK